MVLGEGGERLGGGQHPGLRVPIVGCDARAGLLVAEDVLAVGMYRDVPRPAANGHHALAVVADLAAGLVEGVDDDPVRALLADEEEAAAERPVGGVRVGCPVLARRVGKQRGVGRLLVHDVVRLRHDVAAGRVQRDDGHGAAGVAAKVLAVVGGGEVAAAGVDGEVAGAAAAGRDAAHPLEAAGRGDPEGSDGRVGAVEGLVGGVEHGERGVEPEP